LACAIQANGVAGNAAKQATQAAEKLNFLSFRGALRVEESLFYRV
jgi:hypothetical protein